MYEKKNWNLEQLFGALNICTTRSYLWRLLLSTAVYINVIFGMLL